MSFNSFRFREFVFITFAVFSNKFFFFFVVSFRGVMAHADYQMVVKSCKKHDFNVVKGTCWRGFVYPFINSIGLTCMMSVSSLCCCVGMSASISVLSVMNLLLMLIAMHMKGYLRRTSLCKRNILKSFSN